MRRTFDDFLTQVNLALGNRQDITQTHRGQLVNDALNKVANMYEHRTLQDIVQVQIAQSSDFGLLSDTVNFSWIDNVNNETGYQFERSTDGVNFAVVGGGGVNTNFYRNTNLTPGKKYYYRVYATNAAGKSAYSNVASLVL